MKKQEKQKTLWGLTYREDIKQVLIELNPVEYAYILHDKDKELNGKEKKPHYHIWCRWDNSVRSKSISKILGLSEDYVPQTARKRNSCILYMIHLTSEAKKLQKHIYNITDIKTNLEADEIERIIKNSDTKASDISLIFDIINSGVHDYQQLIITIAQHDLIDTFNKFYYSIFKPILFNVYGQKHYKKRSEQWGKNDEMARIVENLLDPD